MGGMSRGGWPFMLAALAFATVAVFEHEAGNMLSAALWGWGALVSVLIGVEP